MALYNLQITSCNCGDIRCLPQLITVDANIGELTVGNVYSFSSITDCSSFFVDPIGPIEPARSCFQFGCYVINDISFPRFGAQVNAIIVNSYGPSQQGGCTDCNDGIGNYLIFQSCFEFNQPLYVPIDQITPTPNVGDYYFLEYAIGGRPGEYYQAFGCFQFRGKEYISPDGGVAFQYGDVLILTATTQTDCETCLQNSAILYEGIDCLTQNGFIIALPSEGLENHLITYTGLDGLTQYCGVIQRQARQGEIAGVLLVSVLGVLNDINTCENCLAQSNEKKELINCVDSSTEVVWASVLFEPGNSTHLSFGNGCYEVGNTVPPETEITITELANFDPQENCEDCLECHGVIYDFTSCETLEVCEPTNIINSGGNTHYFARDFVIDSTNNAFVPFRDSNRIGKYDLTTQTYISQSSQVLSSPESLAIDEINKVICVSNNNSNYVTFFDYNDLSVSTNISIPMGGVPRKVYYEPIDGYFYVTTNCCSNPGIVVYSGTDYTAMSQIANFGNSNEYRDIVRVGSNIYALNSNNNTLEIWSKVGLSYTPSSSINLGVGGDSLTYDSSSNVIYIKTFTNYYIKFFVGSVTISIFSYSIQCGYGEGKISVNNSSNKIYITDISCNTIYEFDKTTDTLLKTYSNELGNNGVTNVYGIGIDTSNNTWFGSYYNLFELGCTLRFVSGKVTSNELLSTGTTFFNFSLSACCEITSVQSITDDNFLNATEYLSMLHYEDCGTCLSSDVEIFVCRDCNDLGGGLLIAPSGTHNVGEFVRSQYGNSDFVCLEITDSYTTSSGYYNSFVSDGTSYVSCEECSSGATLGLTIINCDTLESSQVNVSLSEWSEIAGFPSSLPNGVISDSNGVCYQVVNACPIDNNNPPFEISNFYYNQSFCRSSNQGGLRSRTSGVEVDICQLLCDQSVQLVTPPHPEWTDGYGTQVTQLNMITLGGPNGLNN